MRCLDVYIYIYVYVYVYVYMNPYIHTYIHTHIHTSCQEGRLPSPKSYTLHPTTYTLHPTPQITIPASTGDYILVGGQTGIAQHVTVGTGAMIAGRSAVTRNVPAGVVYGGAPAVPIRQWHKQVSFPSVSRPLLLVLVGLFSEY